MLKVFLGRGAGGCLYFSLGGSLDVCVCFFWEGFFGCFLCDFVFVCVFCMIIFFLGWMFLYVLLFLMFVGLFSLVSLGISSLSQSLAGFLWVLLCLFCSFVRLLLYFPKQCVLH